MAVTPLRLPTSTHATVYRAFVNWIQSDPKLGSQVRIWQDWNNDKTANALPASVSQLPWVQFTPETEKMEPYCLLNDGTGRRSFEAPMRIDIETAVAGSLWEDSAKLWEQIRVRGMTFVSRDVSDFWASMPATTSNDADFTLAKGSFHFDMYVEG